MKYKLGIGGTRNPGISYEEWEILITSIIKIDEIPGIKKISLINVKQINLYRNLRHIQNNFTLENVGYGRTI